MLRTLAIAALAALPVQVAAQSAAAGAAIARRKVVGVAPLTTALAAGTKTASITRASSAWCRQSDGQYTEATSGNGCFGDDGISVWAEVTNYCTNSLDASAWTNFSAPDITTDTDSGPFSTYNAGAEADTIDDNAAGAREGKQSASAGTATGTYTASFWLASGTMTDYGVGVVTDGTGTTRCSATDLTASFVRKSCSATVGGTPTSIVGEIIVGDVNADTGTIKVSGCQLETGAKASRPCIAGGSAATCVKDQLTLSTTGWPVKSGWVELTYTPDVSGDPAANTYLLDTRNAGDGVSIYIDTDGDLFGTSGDGGTTATTTAATNPTWTADTSYLIRIEWGPGWLAVYRDGTLAGSQTTVTLPGAHAASAGLCMTAAAASQCNGFIKGLLVGVL